MKERKYKCLKCGEYKSYEPLIICDCCVEKQFEFERLAEIGRATKKFYEQSGATVEFMTYEELNGSKKFPVYNYLVSVEMLIEWYRTQK